MSYYSPTSSESATEPEHGIYGGGAMYDELADFHASINNGSNARTFSPSQKDVQDFLDGAHRLQPSYGNIIYSPRMSQGGTDYDPSMATGHINNNAYYDASAYGDMLAMSAALSGTQPTVFDNLQSNTAGPAYNSNWAAEEFPASPTYNMVAMATAAPMHTPAQPYYNAADMIYIPPHHPQPAINDYLGPFAESTDIPMPLYPPGLTSPNAYDGAAYHQPEPFYNAGPTFTGADADAVYPNAAPVYSGATFTAPAHATYPEPAPAPHAFTEDDWLYTQPQPAQLPPSYAQPDIGYGVDPRQLHVSWSSIWDTETMREAGLSCAAPRTPALGYSSGSSATSASPTTPTDPAIPPARALGKRKAVDTGFDNDYSTAQISAQIAPRPVKRLRVSQQLARVATTVDPHAGITNQTGAAALTHSIEYSKASSHGGQPPADLSSEVIQRAGAGPSTALPKTRSRARKQNVLPPNFVPLYEQKLTAEQIVEEAKDMSTGELIVNLTEKVDALVPEDGDKDGEQVICRFPGCDRRSKRGAEAARHIRHSHLGQETYCTKCKKGFRGPYEVGRHIGRKGCQKRVKENAKKEARMRKASMGTWAGMGGGSTGTEGGSF